MGGASAGYGLAGDASVTILEQEEIPGYHTTGRSAAFYAETYGNELVRRLTTASKAFFLDPPPDFTDARLVHDRGALFLARPDQHAALSALYEAKHRVLPSVRHVDRDFIIDRVPSIRPDYAVEGVWDSECRDIDVHALHQSFLAGFRVRGGQMVNNARVDTIRRAGSRWRVRTQDGRDFDADFIINAAGAWADIVAGLAGAEPLGLVPKRRTVILFPAAGGLERADWPLVLDSEDRFYFKPETGRVLATPGDATPMPPQDVQPDEMDVALTIDRVQRVLTCPVERVESKWAGLRTFAPDNAPVVGEDPDVPGFFWFAGQGGYGIQTAPAMSALISGLVLENRVPAWLGDFGVEASFYAPGRFKNSSLSVARA